MFLVAVNVSSETPLACVYLPRQIDERRNLLKLAVKNIPILIWLSSRFVSVIFAPLITLLSYQATTLLKMVNYVLTITHVLTTCRRNLIEPWLLHGTISIIIYQMSETYPP